MDIEAAFLNDLAEQADSTVVAFARSALAGDDAERADPHKLRIAADAAIVAAALRDIAKRVSE